MLLTLGHQNFLQPQSIDPAAAYLHATVNEAQASFDVRDFRLGAGIFQSTYQSRSNLANNLSASRRITSSLDASVNYFRAFAGTGSRMSNLSGSLRETISPRISLLQVINYSQGRTNVLYGGSYLSNRFTVGVDYQTLYLPFHANPFSQGISVTLRIRLFGGLQVNAQTFRSADGRLRYTASGETALNGNFRPAGGDGQNPSSTFATLSVAACRMKPEIPWKAPPYLSAKSWSSPMPPANSSYGEKRLVFCRCKWCSRSS